MMPSTTADSALDRLWRVGWLTLLPALLLGCTATKSTVYFAKAEQALAGGSVWDVTAPASAQL